MLHQMLILLVLGHLSSKTKTWVERDKQDLDWEKNEGIINLINIFVSNIDLRKQKTQ